MSVRVGEGEILSLNKSQPEFGYLLTNSYLCPGKCGTPFYVVMQMKITQAILDELTAKAKESPRLRGKLRVEYYDELERICSDSFVIEPGGANVAVSIPIGVWHTVHALESGTCILEMKDGRYEPLSEVDVMK